MADTKLSDWLKRSHTKILGSFSLPEGLARAGFSCQAALQSWLFGGPFEERDWLQVIELWQQKEAGNDEDSFFVRAFYNQEEIELEGARPGESSKIFGQEYEISEKCCQGGLSRVNRMSRATSLTTNSGLLRSVHKQGGFISTADNSHLFRNEREFKRQRWCGLQ